MNTLRFVFPDQLSASISSLKDTNKKDVIFLCELLDDATYVKHHPKKIALIFSAMRHFADKIQSKGYNVRYIKLTDPGNTGNLFRELERAIRELNIKHLILTEPSEYRNKAIINSLQTYLNIHIEVRTDNRFFCSIDEFKTWASGKNLLRMEYFYREMRKKHMILINSDGTPAGGKWNYDKENRKVPSNKFKSFNRISHKKSTILKNVLKMVEEKFDSHFGDLEPFYYAITREQALIELNDFIENILPYFGDYQDAMLKDEPYLYHSLLSSYINIGLLLPLEICKLVEKAYINRKVPINSAEGFIRQILGWREYVRGIYWLKMPEYAEMNYLDAHTPLPDFYWGKKTRMFCIAETVSHTKKHAYSHHIQRLMITGNFALLAGLDVKQVQEWYLAVYSDAFEWVEMPNTLGMALFGDGGFLSSKPYAASGNYINKMSNFCENCHYKPKEILSENACPFNALYWDFIARNRHKLQNNHRLNYVYSTWNKFGEHKQIEISKKAHMIIQLMKKSML